MAKCLSFIIFFLCFLFGLNTSAQSWLWAKQPNFQGNPPQQSNGEAFNIATDKNGNLYETGEIAYANVTYASTTLQTINSNAFLSKQDANGNFLWATQAKLYSIYGSSEAYGITTDTTGNVYIAGSFRDSVSFGAYLLLSPNSSSAFVAKYDPNGNVLWAQQSITPTFNGYPTEALSVACDIAGNAYITGDFHNSTSFGSYTLNAPTNSAGDVYVTKYDPNGNVVWAVQANIPSGSSFASARGITADRFGNIFITGAFHDTISFGTTTLTTTSPCGDIFVTKYDTNGNPQWAQQTHNNSPSYWSNGPVFGNSITTDKNGDAYVAGNFEDVISFGPYTLTSPINFNAYAFPYGDMLLAKYDANGNVKWAMAASPSTNSAYAAWGVTADTMGYIYYSAGGWNVANSNKYNYQIAFGGSSFTTTGATTFEATFVIKLDMNGNVICGSAIPAGGDEYSGIATDATGNYVYIGSDYYVQYSSFNIGTTTLSTTQPVMQGVEIPFTARWLPCNTIPPLTAFASSADDSCNSLCHAHAAATVVGGIAPYTFAWNTTPVQHSSAITGLCAGNYTVTVTDSAGTTATAMATINQPAPVIASIMQSSGSICAGDSVTLNVSATGGNSGFTYAWSPSTGLNSTTGIPVIAKPASTSTYTVTATSASGCTGISLATITVISGQPASVSITASPAGAICKGTPITFTANATNGGNAQYQWKVNNQPIAITGAVYLTDTLKDQDVVVCIMSSALTCVSGSPATSNAIAITVAPKLVAGSISAVPNPVCQGKTVALSVTGNTGMPQWQSSVTGNNFADIPGADTTIYSASFQQTSYFRVITGSDLCADTSQPYTVTVNPSPNPPDVIPADSIICSTDSIQVCTTGSYTSYLWNTGATSGCTNANIAGDYWVTVTNANGCSAISNHASLSVHPVASISIIEKGDTLSSYGAVTYQWYVNDTAIAGATQPVYVAPSPGVYALLITDTNNCREFSNPIMITGIKDVEDERMLIYPNPSTGTWQLVNSVALIGSKLSVYASDGRIVYEGEIKNTSSEISFKAAKGIYLLQIASPTTNLVRKLIRL